MRRPAADGVMREPLRSFPGAVLEVAADGIVRRSNGRIESRLGRTIVGHPLAEVLDPTSQAKWTRLLATPGRPPRDVRLEIVVGDERVLMLYAFLVIWPEARPRDRL